MQAIWLKSPSVLPSVLPVLVVSAILSVLGGIAFLFAKQNRRADDAASHPPTPSVAAPTSGENLDPVRSGRPMLSRIGQKAGDEWDRNELEMKFCWFPAGKFKMGSPVLDEDAFDDEDAVNYGDVFDDEDAVNYGDVVDKEQPQVEVTLSRGFWLGKYEVTQGEWKRVMGTTPWTSSANGYEGLVKDGVDYPANNISWKDAVKFCNTLTSLDREKGGLSEMESYRLPTEAEWEYACRAGTTTRFTCGDSPVKLLEYAWWGIAPFEGEGIRQIGLKKANRWGLHDMHGNVEEWCHDWYGKKLAGGSDPAGPARGPGRVFRGGDWSTDSFYCRSAFRTHAEPNYRHYSMGFRVVVGPSVPPP